ncbi:MAG: DUF1294 domain-containing protein [Bacteroidetes bacterium]|nr:DUF1294 domain-containing protein [Bacteroidota bacterium]
MLIVYYFISINILSAFVFFIDKRNAIKKSRRIPETTLHFFELIGGVFSILIMMYLLHHKNKKASFFLISYIILIIWLLMIYSKFNVLIQYIYCKF